MLPGPQACDAIAHVPFHERRKDLNHSAFLPLPLCAIPIVKQFVVCAFGYDIVMKLAVLDDVRNLARRRRRMNNIITRDNACGHSD